MTKASQKLSDLHIMRVSLSLRDSLGLHLCELCGILIGRRWSRSRTKHTVDREVIRLLYSQVRVKQRG